MPAAFRNTAIILSLCFAVSYLSFSWVYSVGAPVGVWTNELFGSRAWAEADPGSDYLESAHQLRRGEPPHFVGHPGTPLVLILSGLQRGYYGFVGSGSGISYSEFIARNLPAVFTLSKLMMTFLHLLSCYAVFALARSLTRSSTVGFFSMLGYATSLPLLYYLSRISVEPIAIAFFVAGWLAVWKQQDLSARGATPLALVFAALAGIAAMSAAMTKLNFLGPFPPFLILIILGGQVAGHSDLRVPLRARILSSLVFCAVSLVTLAIYTQFIDWEAFIDIWIRLSRRDAGVPWTLSSFLPGFEARRVFLLSELGYIGIAIWGGIAVLRERSTAKAPLLWLGVYACYGLLLFAVRARMAGSLLAFHYFFLTNVAVAVFFGYGMMKLLGRIDVGQASARCALTGAILTILIHSFGFWAVIESRIEDVASYDKFRPIHEMVTKLSHTDRLTYASRPGVQIQKQLVSAHTLGWQSVQAGILSTSELAVAYRSLFVPANDRVSIGPKRWIEVDALRSRLAVVGGHKLAALRALAPPNTATR